jgi:Uma2 family endonuclease
MYRFRGAPSRRPAIGRIVRRSVAPRPTFGRARRDLAVMRVACAVQRAAVDVRHDILESMVDPSLLRTERVRPLLRKEYDRLVAEGFFEDERVELLHGVLVTMSPQGGRHSAITAWITERLIRALDTSYEVRSHSPFAASDYSEPEPDVGVYPRGSYHDHPERAFLLVEVADSSLRKDRKIKTGIYAAAGVPEYWIVDLDHDEIEVLTGPGRTRYRRRITLRRGDTLSPSALAGVAIAVDDILG